MSYMAETNRGNPSCFLFLIDQSRSMQEGIDPSRVQQLNEPLNVDNRTYTHVAQGRTKAQGVADAINRLLHNLVLKCARSEGVRDYYHVGVIGYGANVGPAFSGLLAGKELVPISEVASSPARIEERERKTEDGAGGLVNEKVRFPIWFEPAANGGTPMCGALTGAKSILERWLSQHPGCFPPIVINITDGEATDGDPAVPAEALKALSSADGNVLLFNLHISSQNASPKVFPDREEGLPDQHARLLFRMSSTLPEYMRNFAQQEGITVSPNTRGFVFNADMVAVIGFLEIGTVASNLR